MIEYIKEVLANMPSDWLNLTTHRLDIYKEKLAKVQFLEEFEKLYQSNVADQSALNELPTAFDYIRLGHPLSCVLEWAVAEICDLDPESVISFSSKTTPILSVLRKNLFLNKKTRILFEGDIYNSFDAKIVREIYGYDFEIQELRDEENIEIFDGSTILFSQKNNLNSSDLSSLNGSENIDFLINSYGHLGSVLMVRGEENTDYISEIQHVRRRETIAMTPANCQVAIQSLVEGSAISNREDDVEKNKAAVLESIKKVNGVSTKPLVGSSGLSIQYAIMMGLVQEAVEKHKGKAIKFVVPPNCYGGTNDQARRVAACIDNVAVVDLPVDGGNDMVEGIEAVLDKIAKEDAVPYIIAEIPTNPRVEVPDLIKLKETLSKSRQTANGETAVDPVFILDQTFCPNVHFLGEGKMLSTVKTIAYASGSKFPSGGKCTAGYCIANDIAEGLMDKVELHLTLCDNEATDLQYRILAQQMSSMIQRIADAYDNTRNFVTFIQEMLPEAKINFVSEKLAKQGFTPSVFSLDLPTKGSTAEERETYKRALNHKLINMMISEIPNESKYCVSYGQLKGCYWTIPATSTQGTTKEGDKDYIARVALSPDMDLERHKEVFMEFLKVI